MPPEVSAWTNLIFRWIHVIAAMLWVGQTYYFTKLEGRLTAEDQTPRASGGPAQVWMVHSGGFYVVERQRTPKLLPTKLHWFRWEALLTWISGFLLLGLSTAMVAIGLRVSGQRFVDVMRRAVRLRG